MIKRFWWLSDFWSSIRYSLSGSDYIMRNWMKTSNIYPQYSDVVGHACNWIYFIPPCMCSENHIETRDHTVKTQVEVRNIKGFSREDNSRVKPVFVGLSSHIRTAEAKTVAIIMMTETRPAWNRKVSSKCTPMKHAPRMHFPTMYFM